MLGLSDNLVVIAVKQWTQLCRIAHGDQPFHTLAMCGGVANGSKSQLGELGTINPITYRVFLWVVDNVVKPCYTMNMNLEKHRKKRVDRNHIIYELNVMGLTYVGVTAKTESTALKSAKTRAAKHFYRAKTENKDWLLCAALRELDSKEDIVVRVLEVVRGKALAHKREVELRRELEPALNTDTRGD